MKHVVLLRRSLGNPKRKWKQKFFILSNFSIRGDDTEKVVKNLKEARFNLIECGWATHEEAENAAKYAEKYGIDLIFQDMTRYGGMQENRFYEKNDLEGVIRDHRDNKRVIGYYIWDEPYIEDQLDEARLLTDICEREAPELLPFSVAIPSYNLKYKWQNDLFCDYLERYITTIEPPVLSLDYYPVGMSEHNEEVQFDRSKMWLDLGLMKKLAEEHKMPLWFYYQGQNLHKVDFFIFSMVRCMMYAGALYGAKGLQHYTALGAVTTQEGDKGIFFEEQKAINEEFNNLGKTLMALTCNRVIHDSSVDPGHEAYSELSNTIRDSRYLKEELPTRISVSELDDEYGNGYMIVLNRDYMTKKTISLPLNGIYRIYEVSKTDGKQYVKAEAADSICTTLAPGDAVLLRIQNASNEAFTLEYSLSE